MYKECLIYCRVSSEGQTTGHGLTRQLNCCMEYASERGYHIVAVFSEVASGADPLPVRATVERIAKKRKATIVCENYDRWSRQGSKDAPSMNVEMASPAAHALDAEIREIFSTPAGL